MSLALYLLPYLLGHSSGIFASPVLYPRDASTPTANGTGFATSTSCTDINNCRQISDIVWGCVSVILACTWAALHPDIPPKDVPGHIVLMNHVWSTIVAFFTPEFMAFMAIMEFAEARKVKKIFADIEVPRESRWTLTHAFFAGMGGFMLVKPRTDGKPGYEEVGTVYPRVLYQLAKAGRVNLSLITEDAIKDKSKGDLLSKGVVVIQTGWFIIQIIARWAEQLPVTELEIITLAFAVLNFLTYGFWSHKPLGVDTPISIVLLPAKDESASGIDEKDADSKSTLDEIAFASASTIEGQLKEEKEQEEIAASGTNPTPTDVFRDLLSLLYKYRPNLFRDPVGCVRLVLTNLSRSGAPTGICLVLAVVTTIFGALHFIAWDFHYPSNVERWLWRASAIAITAAPPYMFLGRTVAVHFIDGVLKAKGVWRRVFLGIATLVSSLPGAVLYVGARIALLVVALMELRQLPAGALLTVSWTNFIPHI
ncbi:uncharacterized protein PHACADRAFT_246815 [Phanerochaete carnosa HHB-10118-sp]|uniref:Wax synthase domain-containing protein n=1 Tax=Phanerochaete carnosa (strain HHB-10118-sp) TaxID=650164 RepID=K5WMP8_PHACS|nr:uncharacterized protein PHACADRAFT_246815 [Phanerochaete carnosa HHB-10118-sp]EKM60725.1 hypothetical protein PHACADRAFT_246815 [Phanerochaete carnosa HHB-10118-sp]